MSDGEIEVFGAKNPNLPFYPAVRAGDYLFVSGQVAKDVDGNMIGGTIEEETRGTLLAIERILTLAGCALNDVIKATVYLADARDFGRYNGVFKSFFPDGRLSRTTVEARAVITTRIEIDCIVYAPLEKTAHV
ncbi:RidA family protein [Martelella alba]|uniref:RidA family protein n=1 Tax=Martelella alba TaxID=2590451 RepID=A0ABY2SR66_9HYPH|nr:RidA family protein [Martelella alba]TKI07825.1 RidA family protein [Martelella alba]